jgi:saccharopine dehydrogenase-like NADP-dependent oxidoreductase
MPVIVILGSGKVGTTMALDLAGDREHSITLVDRDPAALERARERVATLAGQTMEVRQVDLSDGTAFAEAVRGADVVIGALSSRLGFAALARVIESGIPYCDISFMADDALALDQRARELGVTAVVDCGVAPGLSNLLAGHAAIELDPCEVIEIYVGGIPRERHWPFEYKAAFAPSDVIEEYLRPARIVEHGRVVTRDALSEVELIDFDGERFPGVGTLEAFNTDGLRSLARTLNVPFMKEKTLRYPGHASMMRIFRETGLFDERVRDIRGTAVRPLDVTSALLFPLWEYRAGERDLTIMRVSAIGWRAGRRIRIIWELFNEHDAQSGCSSMSRTTAFPATVVARMLLRREVHVPGVLPPEMLARTEGMTATILSELAKKHVIVERREEPAE